MKYAIAIAALITSGSALATEIPATPALIARASAMPTCDAIIDKRWKCLNFTYDKKSAANTETVGAPIYHFRRVGNETLVCAYHYGANGGFCGRTPLSVIRKIDAVAQDACEHGEPNIPHAITGEAIVLQYACKGGRMVREPYAYHFDSEGYDLGQWRALR